MASISIKMPLLFNYINCKIIQTIIVGSIILKMIVNEVNILFFRAHCD